MRPTGRLVPSLLLLIWCATCSFSPASATPSISATAGLVMDAETQEILFAKNPHLRLPMASTTKVMTGLLGVEYLVPDDFVRVSAYAASTAPSKIYLKAGDMVSTADLLQAILLKSANDASVALAEKISGSEAVFAQLMTRRARELGARNTRFENASGLPAEGHYSTAYDLAILLRYAMQHHAFVDIVQLRTARITSLAGRVWRIRNHNRLLWTFPGALGGKTGWTKAAKYCYVGMAEQGGRTVIIAVLGSSQLWDDVRQLLKDGFSGIDPEYTRVLLSRPAQLPPSKRIARAEQKPGAVNGNGASPYTVQVGAFREKKRAELLRQKLRKQGYAAYVTSTGTRLVKWYRVRVGEFSTDVEARRLIGHLKSRMGLNGLVATHD